jgi:hypothetical protein
MYAISKSNQSELIRLLEFLRTVPGDDLKTVNARRRAGLSIKMLNKAKVVE